MTVNLPTIYPRYKQNRDGSLVALARLAGQGADAIFSHCRSLAVKKEMLARPIREFRYNPMRTGEMAEWLKAAVC